MGQFDHIKDIARFGLENDQVKLQTSLNDLIAHAKQTNKTNLAIQLQSILKESQRKQHTNSITKVGSEAHLRQVEDRETGDLILETLASDYRMENLIASDETRRDLALFLEEHRRASLLQQFNLPVANRILLHGPSGCGKTLAAYVIAGELERILLVVNLGAIVSSKLGETSKNLAKVFKRASQDNCIILLDELDSLGKVRDYSQDHGEMKRVVNTLLQLFDFLPEETIVIAATNQVDMVDDALKRRFDLNLKLDLPGEIQIKDLITIILKHKIFKFDKPKVVASIIKSCVGLSYYSVQKTLVSAMKRSLFSSLQDNNVRPLVAELRTDIWKDLIIHEHKALGMKADIV